MKDFFKGKLVTGLVVIATVILAGVAIFTALRLYQLRQESVSPGSPESAPLAWDCSKYTFSVSGNGTVTADNKSSRNEPAQQAKVYINGSLAATLNVPALTPGQSATLGTVQVPSGSFSWKVDGTLDCSSSGQAGPISCQLLTFTIRQNSPTVTLTPSPAPTLPPNQTPTPTEEPIGGISPTVTLTPSPAPTATPEPSVTTAPTPTPTPPPPPSIPEPPNCTAEKPDAPVLESVRRSGTEATLTWSGVDLATHYVISYGTSPTNLQYGVPNTGKVTTYTIKSLGANTKYYFTVYAVNDCMPSEGSTIITSVAGTSAETGTGGGEQLPTAGVTLPTLAGVIGGFALLFLALVLAF